MNEIREFFANTFSGFTITDALDIILVTFVTYFVLKLITETRAGQILRGVLVLVAVTFISGALELHTLNWICKSAVTLGAFALIIVFQPELRRALEFMGRGTIISDAIGQSDKEKAKKDVAYIVKAVDEFSRDRTGALMVFERGTVLEDIAETGTLVDAKITDQLLGNIFYEGSPLHDGAVIISKGRIYAAGCVLPLTKSQEISKSLGTRHRAGIGITENSDALVIIVSEETGIISVAEDGKLERFLDVKAVEKKLLGLFLNERSNGGKFSNLPGAKKMFDIMVDSAAMAGYIYRDRSEMEGKKNAKK